MKSTKRFFADQKRRPGGITSMHLKDLLALGKSGLPQDKVLRCFRATEISQLVKDLKEKGCPKNPCCSFRWISTLQASSSYFHGSDVQCPMFDHFNS